MYHHSPRKLITYAILASRNLDTLDRQVEEGLQVLRRGGLVAFPTDTVYGLGADALNEDAVERIYVVKERPPDQPLPLLVAGLTQVESVAVWTPLGLALAEHFWPGPLTLVLPARESLPPILTAGTGKVGVRQPNHHVPLALIRGLGGPLVGTSANLSGRHSALTADEVRLQLGAKIDLVIDGGRCSGGIESTVIDVCGAVASLVRAGAIPSERVKAFLREAIQLDNR